MKTRQAKKIVKRHAIRCRRRIDGPADVLTGGEIAYAEGVYQKALRIIHRKMDRELQDREPGAIERLAQLNRDRNAARLAVLIARAS
ncbi:MAG: hypothetical protein ACO22A_05565 [Schleiferiaceae bacterium]